MQKEFTLNPKKRGFHLINDEIMANISELPAHGILHLFIKHTSAAITINENADPSVQCDLENIFNRIVKEKETFYTHVFEGDDDMPAHAKASIIGSSVTIPITNKKLNMGVWQGIYLCEFRNKASGRQIIATILC